MVAISGPEQERVFDMGSSDQELAEQAALDRDADYYTDDEQPLHPVALTVPYSMSRYESTNEQFCAVMDRAMELGLARIQGQALTDAGGRLALAGLDPQADHMRAQHGLVIVGGRLEPVEGREHHPVSAVSWYGAVVFANVLSEMAGLEPVYDLADWTWDTSKNGYRLPTEAEWEYAARGSERHVYAWGDEMDGRYVSQGTLRPVGYHDGSLRDGRQTLSNASPFGLFDMTGNVWEWVWDWYGRDYYGRSPAADPLGPETGDPRPPYDLTSTRVWRGCGWMASPGMGYLRVAKRWSAAPGAFYAETGFRLARTTR